jgi:hypothetical protein
MPHRAPDREFLRTPCNGGASQSGTCVPYVLLEFFPPTCYFSTMSDRMFAQTCPNCGGICPQQAESCKYCKIQFCKCQFVFFEQAGPAKRRSAYCCDHTRYRNGSRTDRDQYLALLTYSSASCRDLVGAVSKNGNALESAVIFRSRGLLACTTFGCLRAGLSVVAAITHS